jgi:hypothetical protein
MMLRRRIEALEARATQASRRRYPISGCPYPVGQLPSREEVLVSIADIVEEGVGRKLAPADFTGDIDRRVLRFLSQLSPDTCVEQIREAFEERNRLPPDELAKLRTISKFRNG